jgi:hypothetical protein
LQSLVPPVGDAKQLKCPKAMTLGALQMKRLINGQGHGGQMLSWGMPQILQLSYPVAAKTSSLNFQPIIGPTFSYFGFNIKLGFKGTVSEVPHAHYWCACAVAIVIPIWVFYCTSDKNEARHTAQ